MKTKTVTLYEYDELPTERAKERARDWYLSCTESDTYAWEDIQADAEMVGLEIESLDQHRPNKGRFTAGALETAHKIEKDHGESCETHKTTVKFLADRDEIIDTAERDEDGEFSDVDAVDDKLDTLEGEYLHDLLEDYRVNLEKNIAYQQSREAIEESIRANGYTFTEDGKRED